MSEPPGRIDRQHLRQVVAEELGGELRLARADPVDVAAQRVDLAVVRDQAVRVRELPAREGVRREARVDERERAREPLVGEVREVAPQLRRGEHPLVDDRSRREARDHEIVARRAARRRGGSRRACARSAIRSPARSSDAPTNSCRITGAKSCACEPASSAGSGRRASRGRRCPSASDRLLEQLLEAAAALGLVRQEAHRDAVAPGRRQLEAARRCAGMRRAPGRGCPPRRRSLHRPRRRRDARDSRAPAARERRSRGCAAVEPRDERDAAGVVLVRGVVQTLLLHRSSPA